MLGGLTRPQDVPISGRRADDSPSNLSLTFRRIQWRLFQNKEDKRIHDLETSSNPAYTYLPKQDLSIQQHDQEGHQERHQERHRERHQERTPPPKAPELLEPQNRTRPLGPREPPKGFRLFKRRNSKRTSKLLDGQESSCLQKEPRPSTSRPSTARYDAPPSSNFQLSSPQGNETTANEIRPKTAYVPKHAASDFSKLNISPTKKAAPPAYQQRPESFSDPNNEHSSDYQAFLNAEKNNTRSFLTKQSTTTPRSTRVMDDIISNHQASARRKSFCQDSVRSRPVSITGSFRDRISEYIKPSRPSSIYDQPALDGDEKSVTGSYRSSARPGSRWSRVGGSMRRSFSRDRGEEGDEAGKRRSFVAGREGGNGERRRSRVMPVSPGLKKYNAGIKPGDFWR